MYVLSKENRLEYADNPPGKPKKYTNKQLKDALTLREKFNFEEVSNITGICVRTLYRSSKKFEDR